MKINSKNLIVWLLFISVITLGFVASDKQNQIDNYKNLEIQQENLLYGDNKVAGYTCGVLNKDRAKSILGSESVDSEFSQGPTDIIVSPNRKLDKIFWSDNCRYEDSANSSKYVEFYVATFQDNFEAMASFDSFLPLVGSSEEIDSENFGQKLIYDSGVMFLLADNQIIQVAANNASPMESKEFTKSTFYSILK